MGHCRHNAYDLAANDSNFAPLRRWNPGTEARNVYLGVSLRSVVRRSKRVAFRRQRVPLEILSDESAAEEVAEDPQDSEKIEVHVHVHRGERSKGPVKRRALKLRGKLFDWQWYNEQLSKRPPQHTMPGRWSPGATCSACKALVSAKVRQCPRCGAPRSRRRIPPFVMALLGLAGFGVVLALGLRVLGPSVPEAQAPNPAGRWSDDDIVIVEVPTSSPSPFSPAIGPPSSSGNVATR